MVETASKYRIDRSSGGGRTELEESKVHQRNVDGNNRDRMVKVGVCDAECVQIFNVWEKSEEELIAEEEALFMQDVHNASEDTHFGLRISRDIKEEEGDSSKQSTGTVLEDQYAFLTREYIQEEREVYANKSDAMIGSVNTLNNTAFLDECYHCECIRKINWKKTIEKEITRLDGSFHTVTLVSSAFIEEGIVIMIFDGEDYYVKLFGESSKLDSELLLIPFVPFTFFLEAIGYSSSSSSSSPKKCAGVVSVEGDVRILDIIISSLSDKTTTQAVPKTMISFIPISSFSSSSSASVVGSGASTLSATSALMKSTPLSSTFPFLSFPSSSLASSSSSPSLSWVSICDGLIFSLCDGILRCGSDIIHERVFNALFYSPCLIFSTEDGNVFVCLIDNGERRGEYPSREESMVDQGETSSECWQMLLAHMFANPLYLITEEVDTNAPLFCISKEVCEPGVVFSTIIPPSNDYMIDDLSSSKSGHTSLVKKHSEAIESPMFDSATAEVNLSSSSSTPMPPLPSASVVGSGASTLSATSALMKSTPLSSTFPFLSFPSSSLASSSSSPSLSWVSICDGLIFSLCDGILRCGSDIIHERVFNALFYSPCLIFSTEDGNVFVCLIDNGERRGEYPSREESMVDQGETSSECWQMLLAHMFANPLYLITEEVDTNAPLFCISKEVCEPGVVFSTIIPPSNDYMIDDLSSSKSGHTSLVKKHSEAIESPMFDSATAEVNLSSSSSTPMPPLPSISVCVDRGSTQTVYPRSLALPSLLSILIAFFRHTQKEELQEEHMINKEDAELGGEVSCECMLIEEDIEKEKLHEQRKKERKEIKMKEKLARKKQKQQNQSVSSISSTSTYSSSFSQYSTISTTEQNDTYTPVLFSSFSVTPDHLKILSHNLTHIQQQTRIPFLSLLLVMNTFFGAGFCSSISRSASASIDDDSASTIGLVLHTIAHFHTDDELFRFLSVEDPRISLAVAGNSQKNNTVVVGVSGGMSGESFVEPVDTGFSFVDKNRLARAFTRDELSFLTHCCTFLYGLCLECKHHKSSLFIQYTKELLNVGLGKRKGIAVVLVNTCIDICNNELSDIIQSRTVAKDEEIKELEGRGVEMDRFDESSGTSEEKEEEDSEEVRTKEFERNNPLYAFSSLDPMLLFSSSGPPSDLTSNYADSDVFSTFSPHPSLVSLLSTLLPLTLTLSVSLTQLLHSLFVFRPLREAQRLLKLFANVLGCGQGVAERVSSMYELASPSSSQDVITLSTNRPSSHALHRSSVTLSSYTALLSLGLLEEAIICVVEREKHHLNIRGCNMVDVLRRAQEGAVSERVLPFAWRKKCPGDIGPSGPIVYTLKSQSIAERKKGKEKKKEKSAKNKKKKEGQALFEEPSHPSIRSCLLSNLSQRSHIYVDAVEMIRPWEKERNVGKSQSQSQPHRDTEDNQDEEEERGRENISSPFHAHDIASQDKSSQDKSSQDKSRERIVRRREALSFSSRLFLKVASGDVNGAIIDCVKESKQDLGIIVQTIYILKLIEEQRQQALREKEKKMKKRREEEEEEEEEGELLTRTSEERVRKEREIQSDVISREEEEKKESSSSVSIIGNGKKEGSKVESIGSFNWEKVSEMLDSPIFEPSFDHKAAISAIAEARIPSYLAQLGISSTYSVSKDEEEEEDGDTFSKVIGKIKAKGHVHLGEGSESEATSVVESAEVVESMHKQQDKNVLSSLLGLMGKMVHSLHISECILWVRRLSVVYINELSCSNGVMEVFKGQYDVEKMRTSLRCLSLTGCVVLCARFVDELLAVSKRYIQKKIKMDSKISVLQEKVLELQQIVKRERIEREEREMKEEHGKKSRKSKKPRKTKNENFLAKAMAELESLALSDEEIERLTDVAEILSIIGYEEHAHDMKCCFNFKKQASLFF
ncbi:hypothetical protein ADUPG1_011016 [Aduncisulcus paluster]|uniref:Uncharacterized protein n=1 Tax=Aduncisulcus paluster TaxID=2918883 RepID=A0ABQ5JXU3_9EUKA|nr:hypothetical protein ADUPG1_011016 [Aduncisulcus paluster]